MHHLTLSGGGIRGFAHIGICKALEEKGYEFGSISGTSAGSIMGVFLAAKIPAIEIEKIFLQKQLFQFFSPALSTFGPMDLSRIKSLIEQNVHFKNIEDLPLPITICCTDITNGIPIYFSRGSISTIVMASAGVPGVFQPIKYKNLYLVDGGVTDNFPIINTNGLPIIGCDINPISKTTPRDMAQVLEKSLRIMTNKDTIQKYTSCEIFIQPPELINIRQSIFNDPKKIIDIGYRYTKKFLEKKKIANILELDLKK